MHSAATLVAPRTGTSLAHCGTRIQRFREEEAAIDGLLTAIHTVLSGSLSERVDADIVHAQELSDDEAPRAERDESITKLREQLINLRNTLSGVYGAKILVPYGLSGETPDDAELLVTRAKNTESLLRSRAITETAQQEGVSLNLTTLAKSLGSARTRVATALSSVRREEREAQLTLKRRNSALSTWNARYQGVADILTGFYELVGRADLADLVRPTARRRAGLIEEADANTPAEAATKEAPADSSAKKPPAE